MNTGPLYRTEVVLTEIAEGVYADEDSDTLFRLDMVSYEDMGHPAKITVVIVPGDELNGDGV